MDLRRRRPRLLAAVRWIRLLSADPSISRARTLIRSRAEYADLTSSQYSEALTWLTEIGAVALVAGKTTAEVTDPWRGGDDRAIGQLLLRATLYQDQPAWLEDAADLIAEPEDAPLDLLGLSRELGLTTNEAFEALLATAGKVDLEVRAEVGEAGERAVVSLLGDLQSEGVLSLDITVDWVSQRDDSAGYDICVRGPHKNWLLEVKSTVRAGRFRLFLSRNEYEVGRRNPEDWFLVAVLLSRDLDDVLALGSCRIEDLAAVVPHDVDRLARWQQARIDLGAGLAVPGLPTSLMGENSWEAEPSTRGAVDEFSPPWLGQ
jgi:hypothetical protein